jgi:hypothetical protein
MDAYTRLNTRICPVALVLKALEEETGELIAPFAIDKVLAHERDEALRFVGRRCALTSSRVSRWRLPIRKDNLMGTKHSSYADQHSPAELEEVHERVVALLGEHAAHNVADDVAQATDGEQMALIAQAAYDVEAITEAPGDTAWAARHRDPLAVADERPKLS